MLHTVLHAVEGVALEVFLVSVALTVLYLLACVVSREVTRRWPLVIEPARERPPREKEIDLEKERKEYLAARDSYLENRDLRRVA